MTKDNKSRNGLASIITQNYDSSHQEKLILKLFKFLA